MKLRIVSEVLLLTAVLIFSDFVSDSRVGAQNIIIAFPDQNVDVELMCDVTGDGGTAWRINGTLHSPSELFAGVEAGYNVSGRNLVVEDIVMNDVRNDSQYQCEITQIPPDPNIVGNLTILYVAGAPSIVPNVMMNNITVTLSWGEPFNNFDPIVNYTVTVSCSGDATCPSNFTTNNTARIYVITTNFTPMTDYTFSVVATNSIGSGEAGVEMITTPPGTPREIPDVMIKDGSIMINGTNVSQILSWEEPMIYYKFGPIINYTVSCLGDTQCPKDITTTDNTTRSYSINNLTPFTNYTFSVVATNSFGSGEAGVETITTEGIDTITGLNLTCGPDDLVNKCLVKWDPSAEGLYRFDQNGLINNIVDTTKMLIVSPPSGEFTYTVVVKVAARNTFGVGPDATSRATINAASVIKATESLPNVISREYSINVTCLIHEDSTAKLCVVMVFNNSSYLSGRASIINGEATVKVNKLQCATKYNIEAAGTLNNGDLVGPRSSHGNFITGACPDNSSNRTLIAIVMSVVGMFLFINIFIAAMFAACMRTQTMKEEKTTCYLRVMWILFIVSFGLGFLFLKIYLYCHRRKDEEQNEEEMKDSIDLYASPKKKENVEVDPKQQELYSYARTGPINVIVPGQQP